MPTINKPKKQRIKSDKSKERQAIYNTTRWKKLRLAKMMDNPLCEVCLLAGKVTPAVDIHHLDSFMNYEGLTRIDKAYDPTNLQSICKECHQKEHYSKIYSD